ncbi:MAG: DUF1573 domain-containing protein [Deltaproteobacteria bacterium]|nr:DUF1573 domain-containing protein [Deltaproteobacteria bacterium]
MRMMLPTTFLALITALSQITWAAGPSIGFDKETLDYGKVLYGDKAKDSFTFSNNGNETLIIEKLNASCGCTKAIKGSNEVPPKGRSSITAEFDTNGLRPGRKEKSIFVHSNDPQRPVVKLTLLADVIKDLTVDPPSLAKQLPGFTENISFPMRIANSSDKPFTIKGIKLKPDGLQASLSAVPVIVEPHGAVPFTIKFKLVKEPDRYYYMGRLLLETDHPRESEIEIRYLIKLGKAE